MGRKKKKSVRCKTSKKEHKHRNKKLDQQKKLKSPALDRKNKRRIPLNKIIDSNGKSAEFIHSKLLKQNERKRKLEKVIPISPANKLKIDTFLFGTKSRSSRRTNKDKDNDIDIESKSSKLSKSSKSSKSIDSNNDNDDQKENEEDDNDDLEKYDIIKISNLDHRVNEKIMAKIINKKLSPTPKQSATKISLKSISILTVSNTKKKNDEIKIAKIKLKKSHPLITDIIDSLNGKKLFGKILKCETLKL